MGYADPLLNKDFQSAISDIDALEANTITIQSVPYPCTLGIASFQQVFEKGNYRDVRRMPATIIKAYFSQPPVIGNEPCQARGSNWRIMDVAITAMTYELVLESISK